jgi:5-formyltetrahydrofolate cyclo-ligase
MAPSAPTKAEVRNQYRKMRDDFAASSTASLATQNLAKQMVGLLQTLRSQNALWLGYRATSSEADPSLAVNQLGGRWAYPKVEGPTLKFFVPHSNDSWARSPWGILEPDPKR